MTDAQLAEIADKQLFNTQLNEYYTCGYLLQLFHEHCPQFKEALKKGGRVKSAKFVDINNGKGFTSNIYSTVVEFEKTDEQFKIAVKVPTTQKLLGEYDSSERQLHAVSDAHKNECQFYELFRDVNDGFAPRSYYTDIGNAHKPGMIIMDDLSGRCATLTAFDTNTIKQFWSVTRQIAHFQAVAACKHKDLSGFFNDWLITTYHDKVLEPMIGEMVEYDQKFKEPVSRLMKIFSKRFTQYAITDRARELGCLAAMHGDIWTNNILYTRNEDGSVGDTLLHLIDWQVLQYGNPLFDIAKYLTISFDGEVRREIMADNVVERFYGMLEEEYREQSGGQLKPNFILEQAHELFDLAFLEHTSVAMILLPVFHNLIRQESPKVVAAKLAKLALRAWLCVEDALEVVDRRQLDGFANRPES